MIVIDLHVGRPIENGVLRRLVVGDGGDRVGPKPSPSPLGPATRRSAPRRSLNRVGLVCRQVATVPISRTCRVRWKGDGYGWPRFADRHDVQLPQ